MADASQNIRMKISIKAEGPLAEIVSQFLREENIAAPTDVTPNEIRVAASTDRRECTADTIWSGGWISCALARAIARKLGIPSRSMGALLFALNVKIRQCELGCFK